MTNLFIPTLFTQAVNRLPHTLIPYGVNYGRSYEGKFYEIIQSVAFRGYLFISIQTTNYNH